MSDFDYTQITNPRTYGDETSLHALLTDMRLNEPVAYIDAAEFEPFWAISKAADVMAIEKNSEVFINAPRSVLMKAEAQAKLKASPVNLRSLVNMDNPDHKAFRGLTQEWFMPKNLRKLEGRIHDIAVSCIDDMLAKGTSCDFVSDVAVWYPLRIIMMILGVPEQDEATMLKLTQELFGAEDPDMQREAVSDDERMQTLVDFFTYFSQLTTDRRANPTDDVASVIANGRINGEAIGDIETISYYVIVATAGHDTTSSSVSGGLLALIQNPEELQKLRDDPSLMDSAVDEAIRLSTPVKHFFRTATEDYQLGDKLIKAGESVMLMYAAANRDEAVFEHAQHFQVDRKPNKHLAFGFGPHFCLGYMLAKMEMKALYTELFKRVDNIELDGEPKWVQSAFVSGLKTLPIRYTAKK